ncbi:hypothetical protein BH24ACT26_BH24ACT26_03270 [soil metagenome]
MSSRTALDDHLVGLAWSLWTELGAAGWSRQHSDFAIDPEALVVLTAWLRDRDPRLRDEATDWCVRFGQFVSGARLKNLLLSSQWLDSEWWAEFAATVNANSRWRLPAADAEPRKFEASQKSRIDNFTRPSLIFLRVRALVGLSARAEILRLFASEPHGRLGVAEIAVQIGYSKRNTAEALGGLELAGLLSSLRVRNRLEFTVIDIGRLAGLVDPRPRWVPAWVSIVNVIVRMSEFLQRSEDLPESVAAVECVTLVRDLSEDLAAWGLSPPQLVMVEEPAYQRFVRWSMETISGVAEGQPDLLVPRQV